MIRKTSEASVPLPPTDGITKACGQGPPPWALRPAIGSTNQEIVVIFEELPPRYCTTVAGCQRPGSNSSSRL
jgi:hypothetical protein